MTVVELVRRVVEIEAAAAVLIVLVLVGSALVWQRESGHRRRVRAAVQRMVAAGIQHVPFAPDDIQAVRWSRRSHVVVGIADFARSVGGADRAVLADVATVAGIPEYADKGLSKRAWWRRLEAARLLTLVRANESQVLRMLRDEHPLVRAQGATAAAAWPIPGAPKHLIALLRDPVEGVRFAAKQAIIRLGTPALGVVLRELRQSDPAGPRPGPGELLDLATTMASPEMLDVALEYSRSPDAGVRQAATGLLAAIAAPAAGDRLIELLNDDISGVRCSAAHALGTIGEWRAAPALAERLDDGAYEVRIAAAAALQRLGAPGTLMLRRVIGAGSPRAAGVARQTLDVVERLSLDTA